jgi:hypothetical protein
MALLFNDRWITAGSNYLNIFLILILLYNIITMLTTALLMYSIVIFSGQQILDVLLFFKNILVIL